MGAFGRYTRGMLAPFAFDEVEPRRPDRTFASSERFDVGGREVVATVVGPAHTPGDTIVHVPDAGVVYAADVLFIGVTPVMWAGPYENWIAALDTLLGLDAEAYVPGHGPVCGRAEIEALRAYWAWLGPAATERHARGMSAWEAARDLAAAPELAAGGWRTWDAPERIVVSVATIYRNLSGEPPASSPLEVIRLFSRVAALSRYFAAA